MRYPIRAEHHVVTADFLSQLQLKMELSKDDSRPIRAAIQLGGQVEALPGEGLFAVNGATSDFDLEGWVDLAIDRFAETEENDGLTLKTANVDAGSSKDF